MTQVTTVDETVTTTITTTITSTVSGGGGGGCVLQGSLITLANGTDVAVQNVVPGMTVLSYDTSLGQLIPTTVTSNAGNVTSSVLDINNGTLFASGPLDQRVFVMFSNGTTSWIPIQYMQVGMSVFEPLSGTWLPVVSLNWVSGAFTVYDLRTDSTSANNYIANGILMDVKI